MSDINDMDWAKKKLSKAMIARFSGFRVRPPDIKDIRQASTSGDPGDSQLWWAKYQEIVNQGQAPVALALTSDTLPTKRVGRAINEDREDFVNEKH